MAKEWYLINPPYTQLSGFEKEALDENAADWLADALDSGLETDVELYNYDLSICTPIKAIIQNNISDTKLSTLNRQMLVPIGTCRAGMYVKYKGRYWLITGLVDDNKIYEKAVLSFCNFYLSWINREGKIIQRWANVTSASQYNNGETSTKYYFVRSDQLMVLTPDDDECLMLNHGQRMIIDRRCQVYEKSFGEDVTCDISKPVTVYKVTRLDSVLYDYQDSGHSAFMAYQDEQHENDGYYVVDGNGYWLCDIPKKEEPAIEYSTCDIEYDSDTIYVGLDACSYTAKFYDANGSEVDIVPTWNIKCDFLDDLDVEYVDNTILISTSEPRCVNKAFTLMLSADSYEPAQLTVSLKAFL